MWEPQPLTTLRASKACRGENFTFLPYLFYKDFGRFLNNIANGVIKIDRFRWSQMFLGFKNI
jgi:hypothetical protein